MKAVRILTAPSGELPYSAESPAPASAIHIVDVPTPQPGPKQLLVQVKACTVIRDNLTWPELYADPPAHLGNDFAGVVVESNDEDFAPGDEVYGMTDAHRGGAWAEYVLVSPEEVHPKPASLTWAEGAALPLSAMTADQALFEHAGLLEGQRVLITGASGAVGTLLVQLAKSAGLATVAASSSNARNESFLREMGADMAVEYDALSGEFDAVIDTVGGDVLRRCWAVIRTGGRLVSVDSASWDFVKQHREEGVAKDGVHAKFFIVKPSRSTLGRISEAVKSGKLRTSNARVFPMTEARAAYEVGNSRAVARGKVILEM